MIRTQTCPRRMHEMGPWEHAENLDEWIDPEDEGRNPGPVCSFCGSLHPAMFLELIDKGWSVGPTDKNYKAYLNEVLGLPERTAVPGEPLPEVHCGRGKFYFQHLSPEQQMHFVDLYNKGMRIGLPGYFYVLPFFMGIA